MDKKELGKLIDHTFLKAYASNEDMKKLCAEAIKYDVMMVAINPIQVKICKELLKDTDIHVGAAIGFPLGQTTIEVKAFETKKAIEDGADEIDYVINISALKNKDYDYLIKEMKTIVNICKENDVLSKVIFENCYLSDEEKIKMCEIANLCKPDYIKTSTGFGDGGATIDDVSLMCKYIDKDIKVKAAGGIRSYADLMKYYEIGARRIGTSATVKIFKEYEESLR